MKKRTMLFFVLGLLFLAACASEKDIEVEEIIILDEEIPEEEPVIEEMPEEPEDIMPEGRLVTSYSQLPITTWEQAFDLAIGKFGSEEIWACKGYDKIKSVIGKGPLPVDEFGYYGWKGTTCRGEPEPTGTATSECISGDYYDYSKGEFAVVYFEDERCWKGNEVVGACDNMIVGYQMLFECSIIKTWEYLGNCTSISDCGSWQICIEGICHRPKSGVVGLDFRFDPNNGWIQKLVCNYNEFDTCPKLVNGSYVWIRNYVGENPDREKYMELI